jgi:hypothetical protein
MRNRQAEEGNGLPHGFSASEGLEGRGPVSVKTPVLRSLDIGGKERPDTSSRGTPVKTVKPPEPETPSGKAYADFVKKVGADVLKIVATGIAREFPSEARVRALVEDRLPQAIKGMDNIAPTGSNARLGPGGTLIFTGNLEEEAEVDFSLEDFGYEAKVSNVVTIRSGHISFGDVYTEVTGSNFTVVGTYYIWLDIDKVDPLTASLAGGADIPDDDEQHIYVPLYTFTASEDDPPGAATLTRRWHVGSYVSQVPAWPTGETPMHVAWRKIVVCVDDADQFMWVLGSEPFTEV